MQPVSNELIYESIESEKKDSLVYLSMVCVGLVISFLFHFAGYFPWTHAAILAPLMVTSLPFVLFVISMVNIHGLTNSLRAEEEQNQLSIAPPVQEVVAWEDPENMLKRAPICEAHILSFLVFQDQLTYIKLKKTKYQNSQFYVRIAAGLKIKPEDPQSFFGALRAWLPPLNPVSAKCIGKGLLYGDITVYYNNNIHLFLRAVISCNGSVDVVKVIWDKWNPNVNDIFFVREHGRHHLRRGRIPGKNTTLLCEAATYGRVDVCQFLLTKGAIPERFLPDNQPTALERASNEAVRKILKEAAIQASENPDKHFSQLYTGS